MLEARTTGKTIKVRYGKVLFSGSCGSGKTNFFRLLMKKKYEDQYMSTGLADPHRVVFTTKVHIQPSTSDEDVEFKILNFESEVAQLRSHISTKVKSTPPLPTNTQQEGAGNLKSSNKIGNDKQATGKQATGKQVTGNPKSITKIENDIAMNSEVDQILEQSLEEIWDILTFVDAGGQPEYISMLPAVNNSVMVTFVVHRMEGGVASLYNPVTVTHSGNFQSYPLGYSNLDLIKSLMSFSNNMFLRKRPFLDDVCCKKGNFISYLAFIGTYLDKVSENDVNKIDEVLKKTVTTSELKDVLVKLNPDFIYLIPVDNTTAGQANEDKNATKVRKKLHHLLQEQAIYEVPYIWVLLELEIRRVCETRGCSFITYAEVIELCKQKEMFNDNENFIKNGLKFHHLFGVLLYFDEVEGMENLIITDHKWLFDKLTNIVVRSNYTDFNNTVVYTDFEHKGIFNESLLDKIDLARDFEKSGIDVHTFNVKKSFLNLLQYLKIVVPMESSTKYFMPSLLHNCNFAEDQQKILQNYGTNCVKADENHNVSVEPLLIQFTVCSSSDQAGSFPRGVFCCLVVQLLQDNANWKPQWSPNVRKIFSNLVTFFMEDSGHYITLLDKLFFLELQVTYKHKEVYGYTMHHHIFCIVRDALLIVGQRLHFCEFNLSYGFLCRECGETEMHMTKLKTGSKYLLCYCNQPTEVKLSHKIWFADILSISGERDVCNFKKSPEFANNTGSYVASYYMYTCICVCVYVIRHEKIELMCTKYTSSHYSNYRTFCI